MEGVPLWTGLLLLRPFMELARVVLWSVCVAGWQSFAWIYHSLFTCSIMTSVGLFPVGGNRAQGPRRSCWKRARARQPARRPACTHSSHPAAACALDSPPLQALVVSLHFVIPLGFSLCLDLQFSDD